MTALLMLQQTYKAFSSASYSVFYFYFYNLDKIIILALKLQRGLEYQTATTYD